MRRVPRLVLAALALGIVYVVITDEPVRRGWFIAVMVVASPLAATSVLPWERVLRHRAGALVLLIRDALLALLVSTAIAATGGSASQLWMLYALIVLMVGWCFDEITQMIFCVALGGLYILTLELAGGVPPAGPLFARLSCLVLVSFGISLLARESRDQSELALVAAREAAALAEARRAVAEQAQRLNGLQSEFVSTVSHELRTPLTAIIGNLATLQRGAARDAETASELVVIAARHAKRLNDLIEDLLIASRIDDGELRVRPAVTDVLEVAKDVLAELMVARPGGDISLLAPEDTAMVAMTDRDHLHRVLVNLAENALKYGGGSPVQLRLGRVGERVRVVVTDQGPGIDPADHRRIFERFAQVEGTSRRRVGGTGLGLHICARLVDGLGGHLMVSSMPGEGASFGFTLPAAPAALRAVS